MKKTATKSAKPTQDLQPVSGDILDVLHHDHATVDGLFFQFSQSEDDSAKEKIVKTIIEELTAHLNAEEEIVYKAVRSDLEDAEDEIDESDVEHEMVKTLLKDLSEMSPEDQHFKAKVIALCESVKHHVHEEEKELFEKIRESDLDLEELAEEFQAQKEMLKSAGLKKLISKTAVNTAA